MKKTLYLTLIFFLLSFSAIAWAEKNVLMDEVVVTAPRQQNSARIFPIP